MTPGWIGPPPPDTGPISPAGWARVALRGLPLAVVVFGGLALLLLVRLLERPLFGLHRPVTPFITQGVCRVALVLLGLRFASQGTPLRDPGVVVANHSSWLDIFALNVRKRIYYVAKSEVAGWAGIGWLARATGTVFITRDPRAAAAQTAVFQHRLQAGHKLLFFPEGTSTDGAQVLAFKPTLFAALFDPALRDTIRVQPVTVSYTAPAGAAPSFYGWWGDMDFAPHLLRVLAAPHRGAVCVQYHAPLRVAEFADRKALATAAHAAVCAGHAGLVSQSPHRAP